MEIALITGASSGIGWETAKILASKGYRVYGTTRSLTACAEVVNEARTRFGNQLHFLEMDVTKAESIRQGVDDIINKDGKIDVLVCNAGFGLCGSIEEMPDDLTLKQFDVNVFGLLRTVKAALPHMRARNSGRIVLVSSVSSSMVIPYQTHYSATKYAVDAFTEGLRHELHGMGIKVSAVRPGHMKTNFPNRMVVLKPAGSPYSRWFSIALESINKNISTAPMPEVTAKKIYSILRKRRPKTFYSSGALFERLAPLGVHLIPSAFKEKFIRRFYKIDFK